MKVKLLKEKSINNSLLRSYWMSEAGTVKHSEDCLQNKDTLDTVDIAIIGGGFVGLWTAIFAKQENSYLRIAILEKDMCGGGASGRNGGLVMSWWPEITTLVDLFGEADALGMAKDSEKAILNLERFCKKNNINARFNRKGWLWAATNNYQLGSWNKTLDCAKSIGANPYEKVNLEELIKRTGSKKHIDGVIEPSNATVQPALLVAGMKKVAKEMGINIYENTPVLSITKTNPVNINTPSACLVAKNVVLATNAWSAIIPELKRYVLPVSSSMIVTDSACSDIRNIGWTGGECITDSQTMVNYYHVTHDNRIAFGNGLAKISFNGSIIDIFSSDKKAAILTEKNFRSTYPMLNNVGVKYAWTGPVDYTKDILPVFGKLNKTSNIFYGVGWSGNGISPSQIGGKILSSLAIGANNKWSNYPLVGRTGNGLSDRFPIEPIRYLGGNIVRSAILYKEKLESKNIHSPYIINKIAAMGDGIGS